MKVLNRNTDLVFASALISTALVAFYLTLSSLSGTYEAVHFIVSMN